jgi:hypothetical protein
VINVDKRGDILKRHKKDRSWEILISQKHKFLRLEGFGIYPRSYTARTIERVRQ